MFFFQVKPLPYVLEFSYFWLIVIPGILLEMLTFFSCTALLGFAMIIKDNLSCIYCTYSAHR